MPDRAKTPMSETPLVSICIPTFNSSSTLRETLDSIIGQTYSNLEIVIADNASTDNTAEIANEFCRRDRRISIRASETNIGGEANFTRCIFLANGIYTGIFHSDDIYMPNIIESQVRIMREHPEIGAVFSPALTVDATGTVTGTYGTLPQMFAGKEGEALHFEEVFRAVLKFGNFLVCPSALVRSRIYKEEIQMWGIRNFKTSSDLGVWLRILLNHPISVLPDPLLKYRQAEVSYSHRIRTTRTVPADMFNVIDFFLEHHAKQFVKEADLAGYRFMKTCDDLLRARNFLLLGNAHQARLIATNALSRGNWRSENTLRQTYCLLKIVAILLFSSIPLGCAAVRAWTGAMGQLKSNSVPGVSVFLASIKSFLREK